jgi:hypothetical protein
VQRGLRLVGQRQATLSLRFNQDGLPSRR